VERAFLDSLSWSEISTDGTVVADNNININCHIDKNGNIVCPQGHPPAKPTALQSIQRGAPDVVTVTITRIVLRHRAADELSLE
jgi:hypothetical protein